MSSRKHYRLTLDNLQLTLHAFGDEAGMPIRRMTDALHRAHRVAGNTQKTVFAVIRDSYISETAPLLRYLSLSAPVAAASMETLLAVLRQEDDFNAYTTEASKRVLLEMKNQKVLTLV